MRSSLPGRLAALAVLLALAAPLGSAPAGKEVSALLARIKAVGREGAGNAEAARAWKRLVAKGTPALTAVLGAMKDDPVAANWLRTAADAIAERALQAGKPLPKADLEKFIADTRHSAAARRLGYEWLVRVDKGAPDRLLPRMLKDPSAELRRDAVARVLKKAEALDPKKDEKAVIAAYRKALSGACDEDQVEKIVKRLEALKVKVDVAAHYGMVQRWHLASPFDNRDGVGFARAYPPEKGVDLRAVYKGKEGKEARWQAQTTKSPTGLVDLNKALGKTKGAVAYAFAVVDSPAARKVEVRAGCINAIKIFLNGKEIFAREEYHHGMKLDQYVGKGMLRKGRNEILVKVCQNEQTDNWAQDWTFQVRLSDSTGAAVPFTQPASKASARGVKP
jgi:hypothetical protein